MTFKRNSSYSLCRSLINTLHIRYISQLSRITRKPDFLRMQKQSRISAKCLVVALKIEIVISLYYLSTYFFGKFKPFAICSGCTAWFVSDMFGTAEDRFSRDTANSDKKNQWHIIPVGY